MFFTGSKHKSSMTSSSIGANTTVDISKMKTNNDANKCGDFEEIPEEDHGELRPFVFNFKKFMSFIGPGFLMSIAYLDPGNIAGDLEAGVQGGYSLIWTLMWATVLGLFY